MEIASKEVLALLKEKNVPWLYHANTVRTSCTFLRTGYLLARGTVHERALDQTLQKSDKKEKDRALGIWYDLFFDSSDIHTRASSHNIYGPVLFCFDLSLLEQDWAPTVWITKLNPIKWKASTPQDKRWFTSIEELRKHYNPHNFDQHIVLRNVGGSVRLLPYLRRIELDNPKLNYLTYQVDTYSAAWGALNNASRAGLIESKKAGIKKTQAIILTERKCANPNCQCTNNYKIIGDAEIARLFGV